MSYRKFFVSLQPTLFVCQDERVGIFVGNPEADDVARRAGRGKKDVFMTLSSGDATSQLDICLEDTATKRLR